VLEYNPDSQPDAQVWLRVDENRRIQLVEEYHRRARVKLPNIKVHAVFHAVVENQLAENLDPVVRAMARLRKEGLSRHDGIHAISTVLAEHMYDLFHDDANVDNSQAIYYAAIEQLTARSWREG
jgi:hypothetical protein